MEATHLDQLLHPQFADESKYKARLLGKGLPASPGAAVGQIVFTPEEAEQFKAKVAARPRRPAAGRCAPVFPAQREASAPDAARARLAAAQGGACILVRSETSPEDVGGMHAAEGVLTQARAAPPRARTPPPCCLRTDWGGCAARRHDVARRGRCSRLGQDGHHGLRRPQGHIPPPPYRCAMAEGRGGAGGGRLTTTPRRWRSAARRSRRATGSPSTATRARCAKRRRRRSSGCGSSRGAPGGQVIEGKETLAPPSISGDLRCSTPLPVRPSLRVGGRLTRGGVQHLHVVGRRAPPHQGHPLPPPPAPLAPPLAPPRRLSRLSGTETRDSDAALRASRHRDSDRPAMPTTAALLPGSCFRVTSVLPGRAQAAPPAAPLRDGRGWGRGQVFTNADTPEDAAEARRNGAEGIGLVRTEHMFFASDERLKAVRQMIMAETADARRKALASLLPFQRSDFEGIFTAMNGLPVRPPPPAPARVFAFRAPPPVAYA